MRRRVRGRHRGQAGLTSQVVRRYRGPSRYGFQTDPLPRRATPVDTTMTQLVGNSPGGRPQTAPDDWGLFPQVRTTKSARLNGHRKPLRTLADGSELTTDQKVGSSNLFGRTTEKARPSAGLFPLVARSPKHRRRSEGNSTPARRNLAARGHLA